MADRPGVYDPDKSKKQQCLMFGIEDRWTNSNKDRKLTYMTYARPRQCAVVCRALQQARPGLEFTRIHINKNIQSILHIDGMNKCRSFILGCGSYTNGELWMADLQVEEGDAVLR